MKVAIVTLELLFLLSILFEMLIDLHSQVFDFLSKRKIISWLTGLRVVN